MLTINKIIYHARLQRAGTEQSNERYDIFKTIRLNTFN